MTTPQAPKRIALLATGGTIACTFDDAGFAVKTETAADLVARVPPLPGIELLPYDHGLLSSWNFDPPVMLELANRVDQLAAEHDGVVLSQGTDTLEETAAMLTFAARTERPVVVTGAMRNMSEAGADGPRNLEAAALVAADPAAAGAGALVVLGDEIHRGVEVTKRHSNNPATFGVPFGGPVGWVDGPRVTFRGPLPPRTTYDVRTADADVPLLVAAAGMSPRAVEAVAADCAGLVVAGFGLGHVPQSWVEPIEAALARGVPVVIASRTHAGPTGPVYRGRGGGVELRDQGVIGAGFRTPYAARIELVCALGAGLDLAGVRAAFERPLP